MKSLIDKCKDWALVDFESQLAELKDDTNGKLIKIASQSFKRIGILNKKVTGYASIGLQKSDEGAGVGISYSETFHKLYNDQFNPTKYLFELITKFQKKKCDITKLDGFLARGLRTLTSLLREPDFAEKLKANLIIIDTDVLTDLSTKQDTTDHTDVLLTFNNQQYRIWLFQFSERGLPHDIDRLTERRGIIPDGTHILCPLKTELAIKHGNLLKKVEKKEESISDMETRLKKVSTGAIRARERLNERLKRYSKELLETKNEIDSEVVLMQEEIEVVEGWFFYSNEYITRLARKIKSISTIEDYKEVKEMLEKPRRYLEDIQLFKKTK